MKRMDHPTHAKTTRLAMVACLLPAVIGLAGAFHVMDSTGKTSANLFFVGLFMLSVAAFLLLAVVRAQMCRCPTCRGWLFTQARVDTDAESRRFVCKACKVIWDTKVVLGT